MAKSKAKPKPKAAEYRVVNRKIVRLRKVRFAIPGKPKPTSDGTPNAPGVMVLTQYWLEVEWPQGDLVTVWKRYKVRMRGESIWVWNNPSHNRNNEHLPKHLTDDEVAADIARILFKGDRARADGLIKELLES